MTQDPSPNQTELQKAIDSKEWPLSKYEIELLRAAAKRSEELEKERDCWIYNAKELQKQVNQLEQKLKEATQQSEKLSNKELLGETERCQFEAMKVKLAAVEKSWRQNDEVYRQLHSLAVKMAEQLKAMDADLQENLPEYERLEGTTEVLSEAREQGLIK